MTIPFARSYRMERCAPGAAATLPSEPIFSGHNQHPVHAELDGDGEFTTSGIAFEDYKRMSTVTHKQSGQRRLETPEWALDPAKLRSVITRYFEVRAFGCGSKFKRLPLVGTEQERLARAQAKMMADKPAKLAVLDGLCNEYVQLKQSGSDPARVRKLEQLIEGLDTVLALIDRGPGVFVALVYYYYSMKMDSVGVAEALQIKPPAVRQTLWRLNNVWKKMSGATPAPRSPRPFHYQRRRYQRHKALRLRFKATLAQTTSVAQAQAS